MAVLFSMLTVPLEAYPFFDAAALGGLPLGPWEPEAPLPLNVPAAPAVVPGVAPAANDRQLLPARMNVRDLLREVIRSPVGVPPAVAALWGPWLPRNPPALPPALQAQPIPHRRNRQIGLQPMVQPAQPVIHHPARQGQRGLAAGPVFEAARPDVPAGPQAAVRPQLPAGALAAARVLEAKNNQRERIAARVALAPAAARQVQVQQRRAVINLAGQLRDNKQRLQAFQQRQIQQAEEVKRQHAGVARARRSGNDMEALIDVGLAIAALPQHRAGAANSPGPPRAGNVAPPLVPLQAQAAPGRVPHRHNRLQQPPRLRHIPQQVPAYGKRGPQYLNRGAGDGIHGGPAGL